MTFNWPNRVWELFEYGWASRPVTDEDRERRREIEENWGANDQKSR